MSGDDHQGLWFGARGAVHCVGDRRADMRIPAGAWCIAPGFRRLRSQHLVLHPRPEAHRRGADERVLCAFAVHRRGTFADRFGRTADVALLDRPGDHGFGNSCRHARLTEGVIAKTDYDVFQETWMLWNTAHLFLAGEVGEGARKIWYNTGKRAKGGPNELFMCDE